MSTRSTSCSTGTGSEVWAATGGETSADATSAIGSSNRRMTTPSEPVATIVAGTGEATANHLDFKDSKTHRLLQQLLDFKDSKTHRLLQQLRPRQNLRTTPLDLAADRLRPAAQHR